MWLRGRQDAIDDEDSEQADTRFKTSDLEFGQTYFWRVRAKVSGSSTAWSEVWSFTVADDGVGIAEASEQGLWVYPNPASDRINLRFPTAVKEMEVDIYAVSGQLLDRRTITSVQPNQDVSLSVQDLPNGIYILRTMHEGVRWNKRFTISR